MINLSRYTLKIAIIPSLLFLVVLTLLVVLGLWQLDRAEEKKLFLAKRSQAQLTETLPLSVLSADSLASNRYKTVEAVGEYDGQHQLLIDNQIIDGKPGYFVLTPLLFKGEKRAVLVNRGWIPLNLDRTILPDILFNKVYAVVKGRINDFPSVGIKLSGADVPTQNWPAVVQVVNIKILEERLGYSLFHFQIELDKNSSLGFKREWQAQKIMPPEQHTAYAFQWFGLALTLTVLFVWYSINKSNG
jgi:surfeit locus 1 family protein